MQKSDDKKERQRERYTLQFCTHPTIKTTTVV